MAAHVERVIAPDEIARVNRLIAARYPGMALFAPAGASAALMRATPQVMSIIDYGKGRGHRTIVEVSVDRQYRLKAVE
jgi:hypothetical protein